jgi:serine/threonine protein kinase
MLGEGAFSKVQLFQHKTTKIKYAVKKMNLIQLEKLSQNKKFVLNEMSIQGRINHPNIIKLFNFYEIKKNYILILEYASKGTLFDLINSKNGLSESIAFYYFIQTLNAIYFLHLHSIIHRDLKPENLLINENNILKLCDFGWSVKLKSDKRTTFCGTVEYMAPEIIKKQQYDETIDVWSLGVLLYELITSELPFQANNLPLLCLKILKGTYSPLPYYVSKGLKDLVENLLQVDPKKRPTIKEILKYDILKKRMQVFLMEVNYKKDFSSTFIKAIKKKKKEKKKPSKFKNIKLNDDAIVKKTQSGKNFLKIEIDQKDLNQQRILTEINSKKKK